MLPTPPLSTAGGNKKTGGFSSAEAVERAVTLKAELLRKLERVSDRLPANTLDELIDHLGGSDCVAEVRRVRPESHVSDPNLACMTRASRIRPESRLPHPNLTCPAQISCIRPKSCVSDSNLMYPTRLSCIRPKSTVSDPDLM